MKVAYLTEVNVLEWASRAAEVGALATGHGTIQKNYWATPEQQQAFLDGAAPLGLFAQPDASSPPSRSDPASLFAKANASSPPWFLRWSGPIPPSTKIDPRLLEDGPTYRFSSTEVVRNASSWQTIEAIEAASPTPVFRESDLHKVRLLAWLDVPALRDIARYPDVVRVRSGFLTTDAQSPLDPTIRVSLPSALATQFPDPGNHGVQLQWDDGNQRTYRLSERAWDAIPWPLRSQATLISDVLRFSDGYGPRFDPTNERLDVPTNFRSPLDGGRDLWIMQLIAHPTAQWLQWIEATGVDLLATVSSSRGQIIRGSADEIATLSSMVVEAPYLESSAAERRIIQWLEPLHVLFRIPRDTFSGLTEPPRSLGLSLTIAVDETHNEATLALADSLFDYRDETFRPGFQVQSLYVRGAVSRQDLLVLARRPDVIGLVPLRRHGRPEWGA